MFCIFECFYNRFPGLKGVLCDEEDEDLKFLMKYFENSRHTISLNVIFLLSIVMPLLCFQWVLHFITLKIPFIHQYYLTFRSRQCVNLHYLISPLFSKTTLLETDSLDF